MARPPLPADERRTYKLQLAFSERERQLIQAAADGAQVTFTEFIRAAGLARAGTTIACTGKTRRKFTAP